MVAGRWVSFGSTHQHRGFLVEPPGSAPLPGVVVFQEAWGVDEHIEDMCHRIAQAGYVALAPDLFLSGADRPEPLRRERLHALQVFFNGLPPGAMGDPEKVAAALSAKPAAEREALSESRTAMMGSLKPDLHLAQALAASSFLRAEHPRTRTQAIGAIGFCFGGALTGLLACHDAQLRAAVVYYGGPPPEPLIASISAPMVAFHGELDKRLSDQVPTVRTQMAAAGKHYEAHILAGAQHAFLNDRRPSYNAVASRHAWARTLTFLDEHLS